MHFCVQELAAVQMPREFVDAIREEGLDALLDDSNIGGIHSGSLFKCTVRQFALDVDWDGVRDEAKYKNELFSLYDYDTNRVYP